MPDAPRIGRLAAVASLVRAEVRRPPRWAPALLVLLAVVLFVIGGWAGLSVAVAIGLAGLFDVWPRSLVRVGAVVLAIVPVVLLLRGLPARSTLTPRFVTSNTAASTLAFVGFALVVVGLLWQRPSVAPSTATTAPPDRSAPDRFSRPAKVAVVVIVDAALVALAGWALGR